MASVFLDSYWSHVHRFAVDQAGKLDVHAENVRAKRRRDRVAI